MHCKVRFARSKKVTMIIMVIIIFTFILITIIVTIIIITRVLHCWSKTRHCSLLMARSLLEQQRMLFT